VRASTLLCALLIALVSSAGLHAGVLTAPGEDLEVSLVTYGPGSIYWERFGHDAIRIRDRVSGESGDFNYGVFDFQDSAFIWNFARGHMRYMIDLGSSDVNQQDFVDEGRSVTEQRLALSTAQAARLRDFLLWNLQPQNLSYEYDYLTSNCSTRIRDALNSVLDGALKAALSARPAPMTYRQQIDRLMAPQRGLMLPMDLGMGPATDRPLNEWQESFLPVVLARELRSVLIPDGRGGVTPLVVAERELSANHLQQPSASAPDLDWPLASAGVVVALAILVAGLWLPTLSAVLATTYVVLAGIFGTVLLALWTLTTHYAAWTNANLLVFNPLAFAMAGAAWQTRKGMVYARLARILIAVQVATALLAVLLHLLPGIVQQNQPWLLLAIPVWLAIGIRIWSRR
jgi:Domain of unknown function (DUF4105)